MVIEELKCGQAHQAPGTQKCSTNGLFLFLLESRRGHFTTILVLPTFGRVCDPSHVGTPKFLDRKQSRDPSPVPEGQLLSPKNHGNWVY